MQVEHLQNELEKNGYQRIPSNIEQISLFFRVEDQLAVGICLVDNRGQVVKENSLFETVMHKTEILLKEKAQQVRVIALIITDQMELEKQRQNTPYAFWVIDTSLDEKIVFENQPGNFYGLEQIVDHVLQESGKKHCQNSDKQDWNDKWKNSLFSVNTGIVLVNVLLFLWMEFSRDANSVWMYRHGAIHIADFLLDPQWWRLLASAFLHFSFSHLLGNMVVLWYIGNFLERLIGWWRYFLFYLIAAVGANIISVAWYWYIGDWNVLTAGASGAIFGVVGMMLFIILRERGRVQGITLQQMLFMVIFTLYAGFANSGVNNSAHVGGLVIGFLCGIIFYRGTVKREKNHFWAEKP